MRCSPSKSIVALSAFFRFAICLCLSGCVVVGLQTANCYGGLIHHYEFDTDASDSVGSEDGTLLNGATVTGGELVLVAANSEYVQFQSFLVPSSGSYSVALFAQQTAPQSTLVELISQANTASGGFYIGHTPSQGIRVGDFWSNTGVSFPTDGELHHYAVTVDAVASTTILYIDGALKATLGSAITSGTGSNTRLGRQFAPNDEFFDGSMDDVRIFDHALSASEVAALVPEPSTFAFGLESLIILSLRRRWGA